MRENKEIVGRDAAVWQPSGLTLICLGNEDIQENTFSLMSVQKLRPGMEM